MTGRTYIFRALRAINVVALGQSVQAEEEAEALDLLNELMESRRAEGAYSAGWVRNAWTLIANQAVYTIGPAGDFAQTRKPVAVARAARMSVGSTTETEIDIWTRQQYASISDKTTESTIPYGMIYEAGEGPVGTVTVYPVPTTGGTLILEESTALPSFATVNTDVVLQDGAAEAISLALAIKYAVTIPKVPSKEVKDQEFAARMLWRSKQLPREEARLRTSPWSTVSGNRWRSGSDSIRSY